MSTPQAITLQVISPPNNKEHPSSWTLPCCIFRDISPNLKLEKGVWLSARIAKELNIEKGKVVTFKSLLGDTFEHAIGITDQLNLPSDVIIHGSKALGISLKSNIELPTMWSDTIKPHGKATLYFHGKTEKGPAAYGFYLEMATGRDLVRGQGYYSNKAGNYTSEDMAYKALLDALTWVARIPIHKLDIVSDSESVIQVCQSSVPTSSLETDEQRDCVKRIRTLLDNHMKVVKKIQWKTVKTIDNGWAVKMAGVAMKAQKHETSCDFENIKSIKKKNDKSSGNPNNMGANVRIMIGVLSLLVVGVAVGAKWRRRT